MTANHRQGLRKQVCLMMYHSSVILNQRLSLPQYFVFSQQEGLSPGWVLSVWTCSPCSCVGSPGSSVSWGVGCRCECVPTPVELFEAASLHLHFQTHVTCIRKAAPRLTAGLISWFSFSLYENAQQKKR